MDLLGGRYRLVRLLGRGGMAEVWDAVDERLGRSVAVKLLAPALAAEPDFRSRFEQEARAAARLSHPNAIAVFDTGEDGDRPYLVMERHDGETLATRLERGPLAEDAARRVGLDVLAALDAAHAAGVLHRDIKPANILIDDAGSAKVADFGIAKLADPAGSSTPSHHTATNVIVGTAAYLAPERVDGRPATPASDVYSVGVVLYEALSGAKPFAGNTPVAVAMSAREGAVPLRQVRPGTDPALAAIVDRAVEADPARRYQSAAEMTAAFAPSAASFATTVASTSNLDATEAIVGRGPRPRVPRRVPLPVLGLLALIALVGLGLVGLGALGSDPPAAGASTLVTDLRALAVRLDGPDGPRAPAARQGLLDVASRLEAGSESAGAAATSLANEIRSWGEQGLLGRTATAESLALLARVPGATATLPVPATTATPDEEDQKDEEKGRGKGRGDD